MAVEGNQQDAPVPNPADAPRPAQPQDVAAPPEVQPQYAPAPYAAQPQYPAQPQYAGPPQHAAPPQYPGVYAVKAPTLGVTVTAMCLGIAAVAIGWLVPGLSILLGIPAVVCGHVGMHKLAKAPEPRSGRGFAIAGLVTGYVGIVLGLAYAAFIFFFIAAFAAAGT